MEKIKFVIANIIDLNKNICWPELVLWVYGYISFNQAITTKQSCRPENEGTPYAWCGKCNKYFK